MRDRDAASDERPKSSKTAASILRIAGLAVALMLAQIAQPSDARAYISCGKIDELAHSAPAIVALIEQHYGTKDLFVGALNRRLHIVRLGPADCGYPTCPYRVVQVTDGAVQERFVFNTTGWALFLASHARYVEPLKDIVDPIAFETSEQAWIVIGRPSAGNVFVINAWPKSPLPGCGRSGNQKSEH